MTRYFRDYPARTGQRMLLKMEHHLELYDDLLADWRNRDISFLEIGGIRFHDSLVVIEKRLKEPPVAITAQNGRVGRSRRMLEVRGRRSIF